MTLIVAVADRKFALIGSDTRGTYYDKSGQSRDRVGFDDKATKLRPLPTGWWASGPIAEWNDYLYGLIAPTDGSLEAVLAVIRAAAPEAMRELERTAPHRAQVGGRP